MSNAKLASIAVLILIVAGCSHVESYLDVAKDKGISKTYLDSLNSWTRREIVYSQFETKIQISATYKGHAFNKAYLEEYASVYKLTEAEKKRREDTQAGFSSEYREFIFYASLPDKEANDFEKHNSVWSVFLIDENGKRKEHIEIRKIEKISPVMEEFFPYINKYYGTCYVIKFPPASDGKTDEAVRPIKLVVTGVLGKIELSWP